MVSKGTTQIITLVIILAAAFIFFTQFGGLKILKDLFSGIGKAFGATPEVDSSGGGETTIIVTGGTSAQTTESGSSSAEEPAGILDQGSTAFVEPIGQAAPVLDPRIEEQVVANISGVGLVTLDEAKSFLSTEGFADLESALEGSLISDEVNKQLEIDKLNQEQIAKDFGAATFGSAFASPLGAFANPDFFTTEEKIEAGFLFPIGFLEPTQQDLFDQRTTELEKQVQEALAAAGF